MLLGSPRLWITSLSIGVGIFALGRLLGHESWTWPGVLLAGALGLALNPRPQETQEK